MVFGGRSLNSDPNNAGAMTGSSTASAQSPSSAGAMSVIGSDFAIVGEKVTLVCKSKLLVEGEVIGDINGEDVTVGESGMVTGTITARTITMHGALKGALRGESVTLHKTARVDGDIVQNTLVVAEGAQFDGRVRPPQDANEVKPQLDPAAFVPQIAPAA
ncbi:MAG TPA: polymer-forming cytoskeletal protein [Planctomycetes bacterium]|nr:polymer-forming cytoskeletal protein [Planctomycetota bacterium]